MPTAYTNSMNQVATYWAPGAPDGFGGMSFALPVVIACRWQDVINQIKTAQGQELTSGTTVYSDRELAFDGYLLLDQEIEDSIVPTDYAGAQRIIHREQSPSLDASEVLHKVMLQGFRVTDDGVDGSDESVGGAWVEEGW